MGMSERYEKIRDPVSMTIRQNSPDSFTYELSLYGLPQGSCTVTREEMEYFVDGMFSVTGHITYMPSVLVDDHSDFLLLTKIADKKKPETTFRILSGV